MLFWTAIFALSMALQYAAAASPKSAFAAPGSTFCDSFSIQTSDVNGDPVNQNHYTSKPEVYLQGGPDSGEDTLPAGTVVFYQVQEPDGTPLMLIRSTTIGADGTFRVQLAPFATTTNNGNEYKVVVSTDSQLNDPGCTKSDNFKVDGPGTLKITKAVDGGDFSGSFPVSVDCGIAGSFNGTIVFPSPGFITFTVDALAHCTVTEGTLPAPPAGFTFGAPTYSGNPATVESGETVTVGITNHLNIIPAPALTITKGVSLSASGPFVDQITTTTGTTVHYRITVTNTGNVPLSGVTLTDDKTNLALIGAGCTIPTTLAVGAHFDCNYSAAAATGTTVNTATADSGQTPPGSDTATVVAAPPPPGPALTIDKTNNAPLVALPGNGTVPTAAIGSTVTFTLSYTVTGTVSGLTIKDVLPVGLNYVVGSATSGGGVNFVGFDAATRTLSWAAAADVSTSGSVSYQATVAAGANALTQPLRNVATIDSDDTDSDTDDSTVFVPAPVLAETSVPTAPRTDTLASDGTSAPGIGLGLMLLALIGLILSIAFVTPVPASIRARVNRR